MKTIQSLFFLLAFSALTFNSCSDSNPIENNAETQKSIALRTTINELKKAHNVAGRLTADSIFCFEFVYPITLSYNNGTVVIATSFAGLLDIISNESPNLYIDGIEFPFQVMQEGAVLTITNETEFVELLVSCGIDTINDDLENTYCFDIVFPITIIGPDGQNVIIESMSQLNSYMNTPTNGYQTQIVFPITVIYNNQSVVINSLYEFYDMVDNCDSCICTLEYAPVCVETANGTVEFGNMCFALCAGFTQNDIVSCNPGNECNIANFSAIAGICNADGTYPLTFNFTYTNPQGAQFEVRNADSVVIGTYDLSALPVTIPNFPHNGSAADQIYVGIVGNPNCASAAQWAVPNCSDSCPCPTDYDPVCVSTGAGFMQYSNACEAICAGFTQADFIECGVAPTNFGTLLNSCFTMNYPVWIQHQGQLVPINNDSQLLQYYFPAMSNIPAFNYPITVTFTNSVVTIDNQAEFENQIAASCN